MGRQATRHKDLRGALLAVCRPREGGGSGLVGCEGIGMGGVHRGVREAGWAGGIRGCGGVGRSGQRDEMQRHVMNARFGFGLTGGNDRFGVVRGLSSGWVLLLPTKAGRKCMQSIEWITMVQSCCTISAAIEPLGPKGCKRGARLHTLGPSHAAQWWCQVHHIAECGAVWRMTLHLVLDS